jgi:hypothetical protein
MPSSTAQTPTWVKVLSARGGTDALLRSLKADPVEFSKSLLTLPNGKPFIPHPAQEEILRGIRSRTTIRAGRRFGKSDVMDVRATWQAVTHANQDIYVIGPTLDQARIIFNDVLRHFRKPPLSLLLDGKPKEYPFPQIRLLNGVNIHGRGANSPTYIRGHEAHLVIDDEAAFFKDGVIPNVIEPMLMTTISDPDAAHIDVSTPFGRGDFYEAERYIRERLKAGETDVAWFHFTSLDNPYADKRYLQRMLERYGEHSLVWQTEYLAEFIDDILSVFPWADIQWAYENFPYSDPTKTNQPEFPIPPQQGHKYVQGVDLANVRDYFVSVVVDCTDPQRLILCRMDRYQKRGWDAIKQTIRDNYRLYGNARTLVDATTLAESVVEDLSDIGAEGYKFTSQSKYELIQDYARGLSEHRWLMPYQRDIVDEHRFYDYEILPSKRVRMEASQGHDDIVTACALAYRLGAVVPHLGFFAPVYSPRVTQIARPPRTLPTTDPFAELFRFDD